MILIVLQPNHYYIYLMERQQLTLIKVKVNENQLTDKENMTTSWITKLASKYKEVAIIIILLIKSFRHCGQINLNQSNKMSLQGLVILNYDELD